MRTIKLCLLLPLLEFSMAHDADADTYKIEGKVTKIHSGSEVTIYDGKNKHEVVLAGIESPIMKSQPFGGESRGMLVMLIGKRYVTATCVDIKEEKNCVIFKENLDVNSSMLANGGAWVNRTNYTGSKYFEYENEAKIEERGLWSIPETSETPPWKWEKPAKPKSTIVKLSEFSNKCYTSDNKHYDGIKDFFPFEELGECLKVGQLASD